MLQFIFYIFIASTFIQLAFWLLGFSRLAFYKNPTKIYNNEIAEHKPLSVIICARNEAENLKKNLPRILTQNYRSFEVVVVNDNSTDTTAEVLSDYKKIYTNLRIVNSEPKKIGEVGKKFPLKIGIESSKFETLILTDADCRPASKDWLFQMQSPMEGIKEIVLGYSPYETKANLLNKFIRFETVYTAIQYFSFALFGQPYMGVGRNLAYQKRLFKKVGGFEKHKHIASGDDDLFINEVANSKNVAIVLEKSAFVYSKPETSWRDYFRQKTRHLSAARNYKLRHQLLLGLLSFSHFFHYTGGLVLLILNFSTMFVVILFVTRMSVLLIFYDLIFKKLQEHSLLKWIPFLDAMLIFYYIAFTPILLIGKTIKWK